MAGILKLEPVFTKSGKVKHRLTTISHRKIAAVHVICPASIECEDIIVNHLLYTKILVFKIFPK